MFIHTQEAISAEDFAENMRGLALIGNSCMEGWYRDAAFLCNPKSTDYKWTIHHHYALFRGALLKEAFYEFLQEETKDMVPDEKESYLKANGGVNNVHATNEIQYELEHRWHSYEAKLFASINGRPLFERILEKVRFPTFTVLPFDHTPIVSITSLNWTPKLPTFLITCIPFLFAYIEGFYISSKSQGIRLIKCSPFIHIRAAKKYKLNRLIDFIYDKIKPEYRPVGNKLESFRDIAWENITSWLADLNERDIPILDNYKNWVQTDLQGLPYLTRQGVRLLLWDLGMIAPC